MQVAIFAAVIFVWAAIPNPDRGPFHVAALAGAFLAYTFTFCTLMLFEFIALGLSKYRMWKLRRHERRSSERLAVNHDQRGRV